MMASRSFRAARAAKMWQAEAEPGSSALEDGAHPKCQGSGSFMQRQLKHRAKKAEPRLRLSWILHSGACRILHARDSWKPLLFHPSHESRFTLFGHGLCLSSSGFRSLCSCLSPACCCFCSTGGILCARGCC